MDNFLFSINATMPIFLVIVLGWFLKKINFLTDEFTSVANKYVFKVSLPVLLFKDIATTSILEDMNIKFVLFCFFGTLCMFGLVWLFSYIYCRDKSMVGAFAQASARGSAAVLGIAFVENICGSSGMAPLMIVSAVPLFNILSVIILTFSGKNKTKGLAGIKTACINIIKNPIIIGIILGIPFSVFNIDIPTIPMKTINYIAQTATPVALIAIGAGFDMKAAMEKIRPSITGTVIKLVVLPLIFMPIAIHMGFSSSELVAILIMTGAPTTVTCYIMAKNMDNDEVLSSNIIVLTTLLSSVTITAWVYVLRVMGCI
jgi:hypothetical protein